MGTGLQALAPPSCVVHLTQIQIQTNDPTQCGWFLAICLLRDLLLVELDCLKKQSNFNFKAIGFNQSSGAGVARSDPVLHF